MNSRKKKLAAAAMLFASVFGARKSEALNPRINTQLLGSKAATPAAAMSQGLNKATTKVTTNKSGLPAWAKWLMIGGGSAAGIAVIAGTIWCCLKDKNKNPQDPNETNKSPGGVRAKGISSKVKIKAKRDKQKGNNLSMIEEDVEGENKNESEEGDGNEKKVKNLIQTNENAVEEQLQTEDFPIVYNTNEAEESEKKQKEAEEKAKREAEKQENVNAFYEKVKDIHPLAEAMDRVKKYKNYKENRKILGGCYGNYTFKRDEDKKKYHNYEAYSRFREAIKSKGKVADIQPIVFQEVGDGVEVFTNSATEALGEECCHHYRINFKDYSIFDIFLFGKNKIAFKEITNAVLFEYDEPIFN